MPQLYSFVLKKSIIGLYIWAGFFSPLPAFALTPNDPEFFTQAPVYNQINAPRAWDFATGSRQVVVALIDTGGGTENRDLGPNIWVNPNEIDGNGLDDDHNGYVDDIHGWNFIEDTNDIRVATLEDEVSVDAVRHGSIAAGLIGAIGNNGISGTGINWQVSIMPLRSIESSGSGWSNRVVEAIDYATDNGADIISMSFSGDRRNEELYQAIWRAYKRGATIVAAAGNHSPDEDGNLDNAFEYPICFNQESDTPLIIGVGSVNSADRLSAFSNFGSCVTLYAPGEGIYSTEWYAPSEGYTTEFGGPVQGTSYATPLVAGAAALIKSIRPDWGPAEITTALIASADTLSRVNNAPRLNLLAAVGLAMAQVPVGSALHELLLVETHELFSYDLTTHQLTRLTRLPEATLISAAQFSSPYRRSQDIALLIRRGSFYYVQHLRSDGRFISEFAVPEKVSKNFVLQKISWQKTDHSLRMVLAAYAKKSAATHFMFFNTRGESQSEFIAPGSVAAWQVSPDGGSVYTASLKGKKMTARRFSASGVLYESLEIAGVDRVDDLTVGELFGGSTLQAAVLVKSGRAIKQYVLDLPSQSYRQFLVVERGASAEMSPWQLALGEGEPFGTQPIVWYNFLARQGKKVTSRGENLESYSFPTVQR